MRRREFIALAGASVAWPFAASAQDKGRVYRLGIYAGDGRNVPHYRALIDEVQRHGFIEGRNLVIEVRGDTAQTLEQYVQQASELAQISSTTECIGVANQRKPLCRNNSWPTRGAPRCRQSVAEISLDLNLLKAARW